MIKRIIIDYLLNNVNIKKLFFIFISFFQTTVAISEFEAISRQLAEARREAEEYKQLLSKKEKEAEQYKQQLESIVNSK